MKALWSDRAIAESGDTVVMENHYYYLIAKATSL